MIKIKCKCGNQLNTWYFAPKKDKTKILVSFSTHLKHVRKIYKSQVGISIIKKKLTLFYRWQAFNFTLIQKFLELNIPVQTRVIMHCLFLQNEVKYWHFSWKWKVWETGHLITNEFNYPIFALFESQFTKGRLNKEGLIASELTCPNLIVHFLIIMKW